MGIGSCGALCCSGSPVSSLITKAVENVRQSKNTRPMTLRLPPDMHATLKAIAAKHDTTTTELIVNILRLAIDEEARDE